MKRYLYVLGLQLLFCFPDFNVKAQIPPWDWAKSSPAIGNEVTKCIATDFAGNIYVAGFFTSATLIFNLDTLVNESADTNDLFIAKYDLSGNILWAKRAGGTDQDYVRTISTDQWGNIVIAGNFHSSVINFDNNTVTNSGPTSDIFVAKYDSSGHLIWARGFGGTADDIANSSVCDLNGNVYLSGFFYSDSIYFDSYFITNTTGGFSGADALTVKLDSAGNALWVNSAGGNNGDFGQALALDNSGNVMVAGYFTSDSLSFDSLTMTNSMAGGSADIFLAQYDSSGSLQWARSTGGESDDYGTSVVTDRFGNSFVAGSFSSDSIQFNLSLLMNAGVYDIALFKYDISGNEIWGRKAGGTDDDEIGASVINVATDGSIYLTGYFASPTMHFDTITIQNSADLDIFVARYDTLGNIEWAIQAGGNNYDDALALAHDIAGNIYLGGFYKSSVIDFGTYSLFNSGINTSEMYVAKLDTLILSGNAEIAKSKGDILLFPNPTEEVVFIHSRNSILVSSIEIFDVVGKKQIHETYAAPTTQVKINVSALKPGVYMVSVHTHYGITSLRMIKQ